ncbi:hypothetical protein Efla_001388 [Eimeria flavescens]
MWGSFQELLFPASVLRSLISSPKELVFEGAVNKNPITFLLNGGADHSTMSRAFALTNGITMQPLDPPIATTFANNSSKNNNPRVDGDHGSSMLSDSDHCYKWEAVYSDAEFHDESVAIRLCTARRIRPYRGANEAYCNYISTFQKLPETAQPLGIPPAVFSTLQDFTDIQKEPTTLPPPRNYQHAIPLYPGAEPTEPDKFPLPRIDVLIDKMNKSKVFSRPDLRNGFYQIRRADGDTSKTSFSSPLGIFERTVMPMGLINAPASFQRVMSTLAKDLQFVQVHRDDVIVHSTT